MALFTNLQPAAGSPIAADTVIQFDVIDPLIDQVTVFVWASFAATGVVETVYDGSNFQPLYTASQITTIPGGKRFFLRRSGGWPSTPEIRVDSCACPPTTSPGGAGSLQDAYDTGQTIVTSAAKGALLISGTEDFGITSTTGSGLLEATEVYLRALPGNPFFIDAPLGVTYDGAKQINATLPFKFDDGAGGFQVVQGADPVGANDFVTKQYAAAAFDSRSAPETILVNSGTSGNGTIAIGLPKGTQGYLRVAATTATDGRIKFYSDAARTKLIYEAPAAASPDHSFATDFVDRTPAYLLADDGTDLASDTIYYTIDNSGGLNATFSIYQIITG